KEAVELPGLTLSVLELTTNASMFDLELQLWVGAGELTGVFWYSTELFDVATIAGMAKNYETLLRGIVANPHERICNLPVLNEAERHQLLVEWNDTAAAYPQNSCVTELIEIQAVRSPNAIAVIFEDRKMSYAELNRRANRLSRVLIALGVGQAIG